MSITFANDFMKEGRKEGCFVCRGMVANFQGLCSFNFTGVP